MITHGERPISCFSQNPSLACWPLLPPVCSLSSCLPECGLLNCRAVKRGPPPPSPPPFLFTPLNGTGNWFIEKGVETPASVFHTNIKIRQDVGKGEINPPSNERF